MRFNHFARKVLIFLFAVAAVLGISAGPAAAVGAIPQNGPLFNGSVYAIAHRGDTVFVAGSFTTAVSLGRTYNRSRLAAFDSRTGALLNWHPAADGTVRSLVVSGRSVFVAGDFGTVAHERRDSLARIDAVDGKVGRFEHRLAGTAYRLIVGGGRLYLGGRFSAVDEQPRGNLAAFDLRTGQLDQRWLPSTDDAVHALALAGPRIYVGGAFHKVNAFTGTFRIAALSSDTGIVDRGFLPKPASQVNAITVDHGTVYVATGGRGGRAIAYTPAGLPRWERAFDGDVSSIVTLDGVTYVGGHFDVACLTVSNGLRGACTDGALPRVKLAAIDATTGLLTPWAPQANGVIGVRALVVDRIAKSVSAAGDFTRIAGQARYRYATFR